MANGILKFIQRLTEASGLSANETALYSKSDGNIYKKAYGGNEILIPAGGVWQNWTPTVTAGGSMTISDISIIIARYAILAKTCFFSISVNFTLGGTAGTTVSFTSPVVMPNIGQGFPTMLVNVATIAGYAFRANETTINVRRYDSSNYALGSGNNFRLNGFYEIA